MSRTTLFLILARLSISLVVVCVQGCVSSSTFDNFKHETRREITELREEQINLQRDIDSLRLEIKRLSNQQQDLSVDVRKQLTDARNTLREMEDRVIEIRLQIQRAGGINPE
jgi:peptidoglycan hydrolase CwlO-like protein